MLCHLPHQKSPSPQSDNPSDQAPWHGLTLALTNPTGFPRAVLFSVSELILSSSFCMQMKQKSFRLT